MTKKVLLVLVLAAVVAGGVWAQEAAQDEGKAKSGLFGFSPAVEGSKILINGGIGLSSNYVDKKGGIPPISLSAEFALPILSLPLTVGPYIGFGTSKSTSSEDFPNLYGVVGLTKEYIAKRTAIGIGAKASYHLNLKSMKKLDPYASLVLGYLINPREYTVDYIYPSGSGNFSETVNSDNSGFLFAFGIGARYFITKNIGAVVEIGPAISLVTLGATMKM
jgi:hypothetical protein